MATRKSATLGTIDELDAFEALANKDPARAIMLMFWKQRHANPEAYIEVTAKDLQGFEACTSYLEVTPDIRIYRPQGSQATQAIAAHGDHRAVPARPARPAKNYVVIQMVDGEGNSIVPVENNEEDHGRATQARRQRDIIDSAPRLAAQLQADVQSNTISNQTILQAAEALRVLVSRA